MDIGYYQGDLIYREFEKISLDVKPRLLRKTLEKKTSKQIIINIEEIKKADTVAQLVAEIDGAATSGSVDVAVEYLDGGTWTAWATLSVAYDAAVLVAVDYPTDLVLPAGALLRARVTAVPDQPATSAVVTLRVR